jgi:hypothetical protein
MTKRQHALARYKMACRQGNRPVQFEYLINEILEAGFPGSCPFFALFDADENPWPIAPHEMNATDIIEYVDGCFGPVFAGYCRKRLTTH